MRYHLCIRVAIRIITPTKWKITSIDENVENWNACTLLWKIWRTVLVVSQKVKSRVTIFNSVIPYLGIYPEELKAGT